jgi:hypothetical protein
MKKLRDIEVKGEPKTEKSENGQTENLANRQSEVK